MGKDGMDCSGFTCAIFSQTYGVKLPRTTKGQFGIGTPAENETWKIGDLLFFNTTGEIPSHVGIYLGGEKFAHASTSRGVIISSLLDPYYMKRLVGVRRVIGEK